MGKPLKVDSTQPYIQRLSHKAWPELTRKDAGALQNSFHPNIKDLFLLLFIGRRTILIACKCNMGEKEEYVCKMSARLINKSS